MVRSRNKPMVIAGHRKIVTCNSLILAVLCAGFFAVAAQSQVPPPLIRPPRTDSVTPTPTPIPVQLSILETEPELKDLLGFATKNGGRLSGEMWTLTHAYESKAEVDRVLNYFMEFLKAVESNDRSEIIRLGGAQGFKQKFAEFLNSKDQAVKAFSLFILGSTEDKSYAPRIAKLVNERDASFNDRWTGDRVFYRGRAAIALGMLRATGFKADIARLLKSKNESDRSGAISALTELGAVEFTDDVIAIMTNKEFAFDDDDSPLHFLIETKQAAKYKKEIVLAMLGESHSNVPVSAAYALAAIGATEHAKDIAQLLKNEFRRGDAAKALAIMGATEYSDEIAKLLVDKSGLTRNAGLISLAVLNSKSHIPQIIAIHRNDPEEYVRSEAARALLLLDEPKYYLKMERPKGAAMEPSLLDIDFHPFVIDKVRLFDNKLKENLAKFISRPT